MKNLLKQLDKMLKNKVVLYGILFLTITNVFGYLMTKNYEAVVFFALVYYLTGEFTRNNILIALVALVSTNALLAMVQGRKIYESMVGQEGTGHDKKKEGDAAAKKEGEEKKEGDAAAKKEGDAAAKKDGLAVNKKETLTANMEASVPKLDLGNGSNFQDHMANLNKLESLLNKQEGLVGSLDKIDGMMSRLENLGGMMGKKKTE